MKPERSSMMTSLKSLGDQEAHLERISVRYFEIY